MALPPRRDPPARVYGKKPRPAKEAVSGTVSNTSILDNRIALTIPVESRVGGTPGCA
ncbi:MAG: hypothetical protein WDO74_27660 [Pseudomonadota bacterium]